MDTAKYSSVIVAVIFLGLLLILGGFTGHVAIFLGCILTPADMIDSSTIGGNLQTG